MDALEALLRPITTILNRNIGEITPARELCAKLDGKTIAIRVRDTALAMYFTVNDELIELAASSDHEPDVVITGSLLTLARIAGKGGESELRSGSLDLTGDVATADAFQALLGYAKPDIEEELSGYVGDVAAHRIGEAARGLSNWARKARTTMGSNIREYLQEESRGAPSRYEVDRFTSELHALRDDVERMEARINRLAGEG